MALELERIVQEALANSRRHSGAHGVEEQEQKPTKTRSR